MGVEQGFFSPVVRAVVFAVGCALCVGPALKLGQVFLTEPQPATGEQLVYSLLAVALSPLGGWFVFLSVFGGRKSTEAIAEEVATAAFFQPVEVSSEAISYHFEHQGKSAAAILDPVAEQLHFVNCFTPAHFFAREEEWHTCNYADLEAVHRLSGHELEVFSPENRQPGAGEWLSVITRQGKATVAGADDERFAMLVEQLRSLCPRPRGVRVMEHPLLMYAVLAGVTVGFFAAAAVSGGASDEEFAVRGLVGAVLGAVTILGGAWTADRILRR